MLGAGGGGAGSSVIGVEGDDGPVGVGHALPVIGLGEGPCLALEAGFGALQAADDVGGLLDVAVGDEGVAEDEAGDAVAVAGVPGGLSVPEGGVVVAAGEGDLGEPGAGGDLAGVEGQGALEGSDGGGEILLAADLVEGGVAEVAGVVDAELRQGLADGAPVGVPEGGDGAAD